ncbi:hypothetical protein JJB99_30745 [Bradyrhizobium diazoefficiens]|uniref:hypothetical protein n=1 Tax=Bradyrhizobium diazoefficiens TaxID=1355477 RepID=UPI001906DADA|nr:hypothetical protein [Bradyrhizobium diazoefficiens]QQN65604.1 hypothetical protein JIR23_07825 [Bradyrhizobium diazoefficiens]QQO13727.1 hypothetical protein JJB99_30745 [Bradyrhizobium diazoefficiens]
MTPLFPEQLSARLIDRSPFMAIGDMTPPRDPDEDRDDEDEDEEEGDEDEGAEEPAVVREPDEG